MVDLIVQLIIVLLIAGFIYWVWLKLKTVFAQFIAEPFMSIIDVLVLVLIAAIVIFYAAIPLIKALASAGRGLMH